MVRRHGSVPAGWQWRDGRPRWVASPALRRDGWKGHDLKDKAGAWLGRGASIDRAEAIAAAVLAWRAGEPIPAPFAGFAPATAEPSAAPAGRLDPRSLGALLDAYLASNEFADLGVKTQGDRRSKLSRFLDVLAGWPIKPQHGDKAAHTRWQADRAIARSVSIDTLEPPAYGDDGPNLLYDAYWTLRRKVGQHMAHGVMANVSAWLTWCVKPRRAIRSNWATEIDRATPPGRIRRGSWDELRALIAAAEDLGWHSVADAIVLGADLSWSQADRLALTWPQIKDGKVTATRQKTGRKCTTPLLKNMGLPRIKVIKARQAAAYGPDVQPLHVILCEATGKPWKADHYRHVFADVRARAALTCPEVADFRDQDLRDTAITIAQDAGCDLSQIASRTAHSLKQIHAIIEKHYGEIGQGIADAGARALDRHLASEKVKL